jgi:hypothetical protein
MKKMKQILLFVVNLIFILALAFLFFVRPRNIVMILAEVLLDLGVRLDGV